MKASEVPSPPDFEYGTRYANKRYESGPMSGLLSARLKLKEFKEPKGGAAMEESDGGGGGGVAKAGSKPSKKSSSKSSGESKRTKKKSAEVPWSEGAAVTGGGASPAPSQASGVTSPWKATQDPSSGKTVRFAACTGDSVGLLATFFYCFLSYFEPNC